jgi:XTP/dITP diphosphohydrolase
LLFATHNLGKLEEMNALLAPLSLCCVGARQLGLPAPEEVGASFVEIAALKARAAFARAGLPTLADDSGLVVDALGGAPGLETARWAGPTRDFAAAGVRLGAELAAAGATPPHSARLVSALVLIEADGRETRAEARLEGRLVFPSRGEGPGFEPHFVPTGGAQTLAELPPATRLALHPRALAVAQLAPRLAAVAEALSDPRSRRPSPDR